MSWQRMVENRAQRGKSLSHLLYEDEAVAKRGKPSMPRLRFMDGTRWGQVVGDEQPDAWAAA